MPGGVNAVLFVVVAVAAGCGRGKRDDPPPTDLELPGDASGAWWDAGERRLFVTDDTHHAIVGWTGGAFEQVAAVPDAKGLGGLVRLADGRFVVTSFGAGTEGGVFVVGDGAATAVPNLDHARRRTGLALAPDGTLYVTFFTKAGGADAVGGIARLDLEHGETDVVAAGLVKPIGIAAGPLALFVTDQARSRLLSYARTDPAHSETVVTGELAEPDLIAALPGGDLAIGSKTGVVYRVTPAGGPRVLARDLGQVRGVAYDPAGKRLFVVEHGGAGHPSRLHVLAVD